MPKMCFFSQILAKNVINSTKFEYFEADPVFAMTIRSNPCNLMLKFAKNCTYFMNEKHATQRKTFLRDIKL